MNGHNLLHFFTLLFTGVAFRRFDLWFVIGSFARFEFLIQFCDINVHIIDNCEQTICQTPCDSDTYSFRFAFSLRI